MSDFLVPVGNHLFSPEQLQAIAAKTLKDLPSDHTSAIGFGVDTTGANVEVVVADKGGHFPAVPAFQHDWTGNTNVGGDGRFSWLAEHPRSRVLRLQLWAVS